MTVVSTSTFSGPYVGNGVTTNFPFDFQAASKDEIEVLVNSVIVPTSAYTANVLEDYTGSVTFFVPPTGSIVIASSPSFLQDVNFEDQGPYFQSALNDPLDRAAKRDLYLLDQVANAIKVPVGETPITFPSRLARAGKVAVWDINGDPIAVGGAVKLPGYDQSMVRQALANAGLLQVVRDNLSPDDTNAVRILWDTGARIQTGDALFLFIQQWTGYTFAQMNALLVAASAASSVLPDYAASIDPNAVVALLAQLAINGGTLNGFSRSSLGDAKAYRTLTEKGEDIFDLRDYAACDVSGSHSNTSTLQAAFAQAWADGVALRIPTGKIVSDSPISVTNGITILGDSTGLGRAVAGYTTGTATGPASRIHFAHSGEGIRFDGGSGIYDGVLLRDLMFSRDQPAIPATGTYAPGDFDYDLVMSGMAGLNIQNVLLLNPSRGINMLGGGGIGRLMIENLMGQPLITGINVELAADVVRGIGIHFWPIWRDHAKVHAWTLENCDHVWLKRCDTPMFTSFFSIAARSAFRIGRNASGTTTKMKVSNYDIDYGKYCIWFDSTSTNAWARFTNGTLQANNSDGTLSNVPVSSSRQNLKMDGTSCFAMFNGLEIAGASGAAMDLGLGNRVEVDGDFWVQGYGEASGDTSACINVGTGSTFVRQGKILNTSTALGSIVGGAGTVLGIRKAYVPGVSPATGSYTGVTLINSEYIEDGYRVSGVVNLTFTNATGGTGGTYLTAPTDIDINTLVSASNSTTGELLRAITISGSPGRILVTKPSGGDVAVTGQTINVSFDYNKKA